MCDFNLKIGTIKGILKDILCNEYCMNISVYKDGFLLFSEEIAFIELPEFKLRDILNNSTEFIISTDL